MVYRQTDKNEKRKNEKRRLIFNTAAKVFARQGYHQTTVKNITEEAGVSVGTFYLYFQNKEDIFEKLFDAIAHILSTISDRVIQGEKYTIVQRFCRAITASLWAFENFRDLTRIMIVEAVGLNPELEKKRLEIYDQTYLRMKNLLSSLLSADKIKSADPMVTALAIEGACLNVRTYRLLNNVEEPLKSYAYSLNVFILQALSIEFSPSELNMSIDEVLKELDANPDKYADFDYNT